MSKSPEIDASDRLPVLSFAVRHLLAEAEGDAILERGAEALREFSGAEAVAVLLLDERGEKLRLGASAGRDLGLAAELDVDDRPWAELLATKASTSTRLPGSAGGSGLGVPLVRASNELSGLVLYAIDGADIDDTTLHCLAILQAILAVALHNARVFAELREANARMASMLEARGKLIQHLSHELKTPLAVIGASAELLARPRVRGDDERFGRTLDRLRRNLDRLSQIQAEAQDIARPSQQEAMGSRAAGAPLDLAEVVRQVVAAAAPLHAHRSLGVECELEPAPRVRIPRDRLAKSLTGLLRNAVEATPDGGRVRLRLCPAEDGVLLSVEDSGVGMEPEALDQIFFGFVHAGRTEDYTSGRPWSFGAGGAGLDLLRTKRFADECGFDVRVESEPGQGSRFTLAFPDGLCCGDDEA
ncbi:MAG: ATP-binding protein [Thermoanaerobaculia bacterium]|nr:ATP-binding protein [Thermoanaerobaculia bacterium]